MENTENKGQPNNILHPLIHQMLIRANNNNSQIIIQILGEFGNCTKTGKGFSCACCHIKDSTSKTLFQRTARRFTT